MESPVSDAFQPNNTSCKRLAVLLLGLAACAAQARQVLTVAAFAAARELVRASIPDWKKPHPTVDLKVVRRQFGDHHTAMPTALSSGFDKGLERGEDIATSASLPSSPCGTSSTGPWSRCLYCLQGNLLPA